MANKTILSVFANDRFLETLHLPEPEADGGSLDMNELFPEYLPVNKVLIEGYLQKRGLWNPSWKSRFFVLEVGGRLSYFTSDNDKCIPKRAKGVIPVDVHTIIKDEGQGDDGSWRFTIHVPAKGLNLGRTFSLSAECGNMGEQWLNKLSSVQDKIIYTSLPQNVRHW